MLTLYCSLFRNIVLNEVESLVKGLAREKYFKQINPLSVQQQTNNSDCGIFAIAFAMCLEYGNALETRNIDRNQMRKHLLQ